MLGGEEEEEPDFSKTGKGFEAGVVSEGGAGAGERRAVGEDEMSVQRRKDVLADEHLWRNIMAGENLDWLVES